MKACKSCEDDLKTIEDRTTKFLTGLCTDLSGSHIHPTAVLLVVMSNVCETIGVSLFQELKIIHEDDEIEDKNKACAAAVHRCVNGCFSLIERHLPIEVHTAENMGKQDASKVADFIAGLKKSSTDEPLH